jgi:hypothetical protein
MNCPYCDKWIPGMTGYQEADNFRKHLNKCRKSPGRLLADKLNAAGGNVVLGPVTLHDALEIRANSGQ